MRFSKSLFVAFAGLGLFACSNEDVTNNGGVEGNATVTVSINDVIARSLEAPSTGTNGQTFPVELKNAKLILEAGTSDQKELNVTDLSKNYTFTGVRNPSKITFVNNGGVESGLELKNVATQGLAEPLYASTSEFQRESETSYKVTLKPEHRVARLQFSGIKHDDKGETCIFKTATLQGVFLNGAALKEGVSGVKTATANEGQEAEALWNTISTTWIDAPVFDAVEDGNKFLTDQNGWPRESKCFAYNIIPAGEGETVTALPKFTVALSNVAVKENSNVVTSGSSVRFATVAKYKLEGELTDKAAAGVAEDGTIKTFKAGYIYNITGLSVSDEDLGTTPEGGKDATVVATVIVTPWTLVNGTVEWN